MSKTPEYLLLRSFFFAGIVCHKGAMAQWDTKR